MWLQFFLFFRYRATIYPCPEKLEERREMLANLGARISDLQIVSFDFDYSQKSLWICCTKYEAGQKNWPIFGIYTLYSLR